jgi:hypothetical protein
MQERITRRVGRFVRLLAGRPPVISKDALRPRESDYLALRADSAVRPLAVGNSLAPQPSPAAQPFVAASTVAARPSPAARPLAAADSASAYPTARPELRDGLTSAGALLVLALLCLVTCLVAAWRQVDMVAGLGYCIGCVLAPVAARRGAQLRVAVSAPVVFLIAEIIAQTLTEPGSSGHGTVLAVLEGTLLALADAAPWLLAGTAICILIAMFRGLPQCVRDLRTRPATRSASRAGPGVSANPKQRSQRGQRS